MVWDQNVLNYFYGYLAAAGIILIAPGTNSGIDILGATCPLAGVAFGAHIVIRKR
jgi:hypothetical protein